MTFKRIDPKSAVTFNSAISSEFLDLYENAWRSDIVTQDSKIPSKLDLKFSGSNISEFWAEISSKV